MGKHHKHDRCEDRSQSFFGNDFCSIAICIFIILVILVCCCGSGGFFGF